MKEMLLSRSERAESMIINLAGDLGAFDKRLDNHIVVCHLRCIFR